MLSKYLYHTITYFARFKVNRRICGIDYSYVKELIWSFDEWVHNCYIEVLLLYKALERDIPNNLAPFDYEEYLKFSKEYFLIDLTAKEFCDPHLQLSAEQMQSTTFLSTSSAGEYSHRYTQFICENSNISPADSRRCILFTYTL